MVVGCQAIVTLDRHAATRAPVTIDLPIFFSITNQVWVTHNPLTLHVSTLISTLNTPTSTSSSVQLGMACNAKGTLSASLLGNPICTSSSLVHRHHHRSRCLRRLLPSSSHLTHTRSDQSKLSDPLSSCEVCRWVPHTSSPWNTTSALLPPLAVAPPPMCLLNDASTSPSLCLMTVPHNLLSTRWSICSLRSPDQVFITSIELPHPVSGLLAFE